MRNCLARELVRGEGVDGICGDYNMLLLTSLLKFKTDSEVNHI